MGRKCCGSVCVYGITLSYDQVKSMKSCPEDFLYCEFEESVDNNDFDFDRYKNLEFVSSREGDESDDEYEKYHVGLVVYSGTDPEDLLKRKQDLVSDLKLFCSDHGFEYTEPLILNYGVNYY